MGQVEFYNYGVEIVEESDMSERDMPDVTDNEKKGYMYLVLVRGSD